MKIKNILNIMACACRKKSGGVTRTSVSRTSNPSSNGSRRIVRREIK